MRKILLVGFYFISSFTALTNWAHGAEVCRSLFHNETKKVRAQDQILESEQRRHQSTWTIDDHHETRQPMSYSFLPAQMRLGYDKASPHQWVSERIVRVNGHDRIRSDLIPLETGFSEPVIDAGLASGRKFFEDVIGGEQGVLIFVDVNDLGWVNRQFEGATETGDLYIRSAVRAFNKVIQKEGLVFRLGGDEFALVLPEQSPELVNHRLQSLLAKIKIEAHAIFHSETKLRAEKMRGLKVLRQQGLISDEVYGAELENFKKYVSYSQEGLSLGAAYIRGQGVQQIQQEVEARALAMKVSVKKDRHQDISKYTAEKSTDSLPRILRLRYAFPGLYQPPLNFFGGPRAVDWNQPYLQKTRDDQIQKRVGPISLVTYVGEDKIPETRVEYYDKSVNESAPKGNRPPRLLRTEALDLHAHSGFADAKSPQAQELLRFLIRQNAPERGLLWLNLLNLGKINYFFKKTAAGDQMIKRFSELIEGVLRNSDIPFKLQGSEFLIFVSGVGPYKLEKIQQRLFKAINEDPAVLGIFEEQIEFLQKSLNQTNEPEKRADLENRIRQTQQLKESPKLQIKSKHFLGPETIDVPAVIKNLKNS